MLITLDNTSAADVSRAILKHRRNAGITSGMVLTLMVVTEPAQYEKVYAACELAGREHPSRIILVVYGRGQKDRLDAEIRMGDGVPGDIIVLRLHGALIQHADSVLLPLLLPDSPVVCWWPGRSPSNPGEDVLGALADRRITDAMGGPSPLKALEVRAVNHSPGDSDLTWTRLTPWRALLAAALDQYPSAISQATVEAARDNAPANLLAAWLEARLSCPVVRKTSGGPGITAVLLTTKAGDIEVSRHDGLMASYSVPGQPKRTVALKRRDINELITEELRRMDADDIFEQATEQLLARCRKEGRTKKDILADGKAADLKAAVGSPRRAARTRRTAASSRPSATAGRVKTTKPAKK